MTPRECLLQHTAGRYERCPGPDCPFHDGERCLIEPFRADVETTPGLAEHLLDLRSALAGGSGWSPFRMLPRDR